ncbi:hypothetical protein SALWKB2_0416 [Snodgrassella alvi wkB2]|nr:hypothetical protein SALWKB2_0416 [Snodgrassella alvi wkB2]
MRLAWIAPPQNILNIGDIAIKELSLFIIPIISDVKHTV